MLAVAVVFAIVAGSCTRADDEAETGTSAPAAAAADGQAADGSEAAAEAEEATAAGDFGDLKGVCGPGDATGATAQGVTDDAIQVGTISDPGFAGRPGLNQELFDASEVFVEWCNAAGGINGRKIEEVERDAKLSEFKQRVTESCQEDFMLVGGGGVFDETGQEERLKCLLPEIPGFQVSAEARSADLAVRAIPAAVDQLPAGVLQYLEQNYPESTDNVGFLTGNIGSLVFVDAQLQEGAKDLGWKSVYQAQYNSMGEASWTPFAQAMDQAGVKGLVVTGEPENLAKLLQAMADIGYEPDWILATPNVIDDGFVEIGGDAVRNVFVGSSIVPPFLAEDNPATQQYLDLFEEYLPDGKAESLLGYNSFSSWLLFAQSVKECGSDVTRTCVFEAAQGVHEWTGGGLHATTDPGAGTTSQCNLMVEASPDGFAVPEDFDANEGMFNCSPDNVIDLEGDYGEGPTLESVGVSIDDLE